MDKPTTSDNTHPCAELQRAKERLKSIFDTAPVGIGGVQDRVIREVNPFFCHIFGYTTDELVGQDARMLYPSDEEYERIGKIKYEAIYQHGKGSLETRLVRKDGSTFWEMASISPVRNNLDQIIHYIAIKDDITERKNIEQQLLEAKEKAEESDRLKSAFLANMSHEIRTPMNAILGFSEILQHEGIRPEDRQEYIRLTNDKGNDLILMDIRMPEMNGLLATEKIRSSDKDIPIIALTAFAFADDREKSMQAGCSEHLAKPVKIEELKRILQKYLG